MRTLASPMPVVAALAAIGAMSLMDAVIKEVASAHAVPQVVFLRYAFGVVAALSWAAASRSGRPTLQGFQRAGQRAVMLLITSGLFYWTLTLLPLAEAIAITFTTPFLMVIISRFILGEPVTRASMVAVGVGFVGVLVMLAGRLQDIGGGSPFGYLTGLGSSVSYALLMVMTRSHTARDDVVPMIVAQNIAAAAMSAPLGIAMWVTPDAVGWALFAVVGILGTVGHLALAWAYSNAPATRLAPLEFTAFLWAAVLGAVFFAEIPTAATLAGTGLIVAACLVTLRRPAPRPA
jgi:drug/metabolite transporter (DMT)-like permease